VEPQEHLEQVVLQVLQGHQVLQVQVD
jgi:hypothetical protein